MFNHESIQRDAENLRKRAPLPWQHINIIDYALLRTAIVKRQDCLLSHVGTNDFPEANNSDVNIAQGIIELAIKDPRTQQ